MTTYNLATADGFNQLLLELATSNDLRTELQQLAFAATDFRTVQSSSGELYDQRLRTFDCSLAAYEKARVQLLLQRVAAAGMAWCTFGDHARSAESIAPFYVMAYPYIEDPGRWPVGPGHYFALLACTDCRATSVDLGGSFDAVVTEEEWSRQFQDNRASDRRQRYVVDDSATASWNLPPAFTTGVCHQR